MDCSTASMPVGMLGHRIFVERPIPVTTSCDSRKEVKTLTFLVRQSWSIDLNPLKLGHGQCNPGVLVHRIRPQCRRTLLVQTHITVAVDLRSNVVRSVIAGPVIVISSSKPFMPLRILHLDRQPSTLNPQLLWAVRAPASQAAFLVLHSAFDDGGTHTLSSLS